MVYKLGRFGKFLACPGYPECKNTKPILDEIGVECAVCKRKGDREDSWWWRTGEDAISMDAAIILIVPILPGSGLWLNSVPTAETI